MAVSAIFRKAFTKPCGKAEKSRLAKFPTFARIFFKARLVPAKNRHRLNGYLAQRVPASFFLASTSRIVLNHAVLKGMFPWRTRYPLR